MIMMNDQDTFDVYICMILPDDTVILVFLESPQQFYLC